jgi:eukaryotic translation initiation factor 2C
LFFPSNCVSVLGQYCAHISVCDKEPTADLERAVSALLTTFSLRNQGKVPRKLIIYRDGVAENQFDQVIEKELDAFKSAFHLRGYDDGYVKIAIIVCQKRHRARFVYEQGAKTGNPFVFDLFPAVS